MGEIENEIWVEASRAPDGRRPPAGFHRGVDVTTIKMRPTAELELYPEANRVPFMRKPEFKEFLADVEDRDVPVPIELQPGTSTILDGRCRFTATKELGIERVPTFEAPLNGDDPVVYLLRAASKRLQLTDDQRAMLGDEERGCDKWTRAARA
jgi:ParB-like chromosome segregation protein Spo0J